MEWFKINYKHEKKWHAAKNNNHADNLNSLSWGPDCIVL